jgi:hypothetical protein
LEYNSCINDEKEMNMYKSKSELRAETEKALKKFVKQGGSIEVVKSRKAPKMLMRGKTTRVASTGTSGFAVGFPRKSFV